MKSQADRAGVLKRAVRRSIVAASIAGSLALTGSIVGCASTNRADAADPITPSRLRSGSMRPPLGSGSITSRRPIPVAVESRLGVDDSSFGPLADLPRPATRPIYPPGYKPVRLPVPPLVAPPADRDPVQAAITPKPRAVAPLSAPPAAAPSAGESPLEASADSTAASVITPWRKPPISSQTDTSSTPAKPPEAPPSVAPVVAETPTPAAPVEPMPAVKPVATATTAPAVASGDKPPAMNASIGPIETSATLTTPSDSPAAPIAKPPSRADALRDRLRSGVARVGDKDERGRSLLQQAGITGELELVKLLLDAGASVKDADLQGWTALHWAASSGHPEVCELLIASGAPVDARGQSDDTPLYWAAVFDRKDVAELLLDRGAVVNAVDKRGRTPLHAAAENDARATAAVLAAQGADVKARDESGLTPLHATIIQCRKALTESATDDTLDAGAKEKIARAALTKAKGMIDLLVSKGADVNAATTTGVTALHLAAWDETRPLAEQLISLGADSKLKDARDRTPLDYANQRKQPAVSTVLAVNPRP